MFLTEPSLLGFAISLTRPSSPPYSFAIGSLLVELLFFPLWIHCLLSWSLFFFPFSPRCMGCLSSHPGFKGVCPSSFLVSFGVPLAFVAFLLFGLFCHIFRAKCVTCLWNRSAPPLVKVCFNESLQTSFFGLAINPRYLFSLSYLHFFPHFYPDVFLGATFVYRFNCSPLRTIFTSLLFPPLSYHLALGGFNFLLFSFTRPSWSSWYSVLRLVRFDVEWMFA